MRVSPSFDNWQSLESIFIVETNRFIQPFTNFSPLFTATSLPQPLTHRLEIQSFSYTFSARPPTHSPRGLLKFHRKSITPRLFWDRVHFSTIGVEFPFHRLALFSFCLQSKRHRQSIWSGDDALHSDSGHWHCHCHCSTSSGASVQCDQGPRNWPSTEAALLGTEAIL